MSDVAYADDRGKTPALLVWLLYLISVPGAGTLLPVGLLVAYVARNDAAGWVRGHLDRQIKIGWIALFWTVVAWTLIWAGVPLSLVLIGVPMLLIGGLIGAVLAVWLVLVSVLGFLRVLNERPA